MSDEARTRLTVQSVHNQEEAFKLMDKLIGAAQNEAVYSKPVKSGDYTVILASEVRAGGGFGSAFGSGPAEGGPDETQTPGGGGAGGGGGSVGRPVAAVVIGPGGVHVEPIFDRTQVALGVLAALGSMLLATRGMRRRR
jgi:uncharacterized spore protein YtfJ